MNYTELYHACARFALDCDGARLDHVIDGQNKLCLSFTRYIADESVFAARNVVFDFDPHHLDVYPVTRLPRAPQTPQAFTMLLRKFIVSQRLAAFRISGTDRVVTLEFGPENAPRQALIVEFTGAQPNVFLVDCASGEILGSIWKDEARSVHDAYTPVLRKPIALNQKDRFADVEADSYFAELENYFLKRNHEQELAMARDALIKQLNQASNRLEKRVQALYRDLDKTDACKSVRNEADLLSAYAYQIKEGQTSVELPSFETGEPVAISLDPQYSVRENIELRYNRCKRATRAIPMIEQRLDEASELLDRVKTTIEKLQSLNDVDEIHKLQQRVSIDFKDILPKQNQISSKSKVEPHKPYKTFVSKNGIRILVGKSAQDNDYLTFRVGRGNDWWLHVAQMPGSHLIVKSADPDSETLLDAAMLAVHFSKLAQASQAEVHATQQKFVHKIKGAPAGKVEIRGERIIHVRMDEERIKRLIKTET